MPLDIGLKAVASTVLMAKTKGLVYIDRCDIIEKHIKKEGVFYE